MTDYQYNQAHVISDFSVICISHELRIEQALKLAPKLIITIWKQDRFCTLNPEDILNINMAKIYDKYIPDYELRYSELIKYLTYRDILDRVKIVPSSSHLEFVGTQDINECDVFVTFKKWFDVPNHDAGWKWYIANRPSEYGEISLHMMDDKLVYDGNEENTCYNSFEYMEGLIKMKLNMIRIKRSKDLEGVLKPSKDMFASKM